MKEQNAADRVLTKALSQLVQHGGPFLAEFRPLRKAIIALVKRRLYAAARNPKPDSEYPSGVQVDRALMGIAIANSIDRALSNQKIAPAFLDKMASYLGQDMLRTPGDQPTQERFYYQNGSCPPGFLVISPTNACNLRCVGCYADSGNNKDKLDWPVFDRILTEVRSEWGKRSVVISGGEPFAYRSNGMDLLDMVERHPDCLFMSYTNGTLINEKVAKRLAKLGNFSPAISVEGWRERTDGRRGEGVFSRVLETMARLRDHGVPFGISLTATRQNAEEILSPEFIDFLFDEQGAVYGWIFHYMPIGRAYMLELMPTPQQRLWMWHRSWEIIRSKEIFLADFWNHGTMTDGCISAGRSSGGGYMYIDWNGYVTPCVFVPYSPVNINDIYAHDKTLTDAWREGFFAHIRAWQHEYTTGDGKPGNWLTPCPIRDHHAEFRNWLRQYEPDPVDQNAEQAMLDLEYALGMDAYDRAYQKLSEDVWDHHYLKPEQPGNGKLMPLPKID
jgi:MoaA/NifB/PqqE/SkfB family radical SAM enzyme